MNFGRVAREELATLDLSLPADPAATVQLLGSLVPLPPAHWGIYIGCSMHHHKEWVGSVYPPRTPAKDYLAWFSKQVATLELNTTFYAQPSAETVMKWHTTTAPGFLFCPKLPQQISHYLRFKEGAIASTLRFAQAILPLDERLGLSFVQAPPNFSPKEVDALLSYLAQVPRELPLALELRHPAWFQDGAAAEEVFQQLQATGIATVITDAPGRRDVLHMRLTSPQVMVRFVGEGDHPTDFYRLDAWAERISSWCQQGLSKFFFMMHTPSDAAKPHLIRYLTHKLNTLSGLALPSWQPPGAPNPDLQPGLF